MLLAEINKTGDYTTVTSFKAISDKKIPGEHVGSPFHTGIFFNCPSEMLGQP